MKKKQNLIQWWIYYSCLWLLSHGIIFKSDSFHLNVKYINISEERGIDNHLTIPTISSRIVSDDDEESGNDDQNGKINLI